MNRSFDSTSSRDSLPPGYGGMREQELEIENLNKQIFNLKLRVYYLEESLAKARIGAPDTHDMVEENMQLKMLVEEKTQEMEEKNMMLIKARNALEKLQSDLESQREIAHKMHAEGFNSASSKLSERERALTDAVSRATALATAEKASREKVNHLTDQVKTLQGIIDSRDSQLQSITKLHNTLVEENTRHMEAGRAYQRQIEALSDDIRSKSDAGALAKSAEAEMKFLRERNANLADEVTRLEDHLSEARGLLKETAMRSDLVTSSAALKQDEIKEKFKKVMSEKAELVERMETMLLQKESVSNELTAAQHTIAKLHDRISKMDSELGASLARGKALERQLVEWEAKWLLGETSSREAVARKEIECAKREAALRREFANTEAELQGELASLKGLTSALDFAKKSTEAKLFQLEADSAKQLEQLESKLHSTSEAKLTLMGTTVPRTELDAVVNKLKEEHAQQVRVLKSSIEDHAAALHALESERVSVEVRRREAAEGDVKAANRRVEEIERVCRSKLQEWEAAVMSQLGEADIPEVSALGMDDDASMGRLIPRGHLAEAMHLERADLKESSAHDISIWPGSDMPSSPGQAGSKLLRSLKRVKRIRTLFLDAVRRAEDRQAATLDSLRQHIDAKSEKLSAAELKVKELSDHLYRIELNQVESNTETSRALGTARAEISHLEKTHEMRCAAYERRLKLLDVSKSSVEDDLEGAREQLAESKADGDVLRRRLREADMKIKELQGSNDDAHARIGDLKESIKKLQSDMEAKEFSMKSAEALHRKEIARSETMARSAEMLKTEIAMQNEKLRRAAEQEQKYLEIVVKERARKEELEGEVMKQLAATAALLKQQQVPVGGLPTGASGVSGGGGMSGRRASSVAFTGSAAGLASPSRGAPGRRSLAFAPTYDDFSVFKPQTVQPPAEMEKHVKELENISDGIEALTAKLEQIATVEMQFFQAFQNVAKTSMPASNRDTLIGQLNEELKYLHEDFSELKASQRGINNEVAAVVAKTLKLERQRLRDTSLARNSSEETAEAGGPRSGLAGSRPLDSTSLAGSSRKISDLSTPGPAPAPTASTKIKIPPRPSLSRVDSAVDAEEEDEEEEVEVAPPAPVSRARSTSATAKPANAFASKSSRSLLISSASAFEEGAIVEARYNGKDKYYRGKVAAVNDDGTYDINYDDGDKETRVKADLVRPNSVKGDA